MSGGSGIRRVSLEANKKGPCPKLCSSFLKSADKQAMPRLRVDRSDMWEKNDGCCQLSFSPIMASEEILLTSCTAAYFDRVDVGNIRQMDRQMQQRARRHFV
jgi:hypothetical protein